MRLATFIEYEIIGLGLVIAGIICYIYEISGRGAGLFVGLGLIVMLRGAYLYYKKHGDRELERDDIVTPAVFIPGSIHILKMKRYARGTCLFLAFAASIILIVVGFSIPIFGHLLPEPVYIFGVFEGFALFLIVLMISNAEASGWAYVNNIPHKGGIFSNDWFDGDTITMGSWKIISVILILDTLLCIALSLKYIS